MGFAIRKWLYSCAIIGLIVLLSNNFSLADESGKIRYRNYVDLESFRAEYKYQKEDYFSNNSLMRSQNQYAYRYYPSCSVYYDTDRKLYYYLQDGGWKIFSYLPRNFNRELGYYVKLNMDTDKPYIYFDNHIRQFPPRDSRKKNLWSDAIFILFYKHSPDNNRGIPILDKPIG
jgi:hypothetical protein